MKKTKKILKRIFIVLVVFCVSVIASGIGIYFITTSSVALNTEKLENTKASASLQIFDINGNLIRPASENYISIKKLSASTKSAFICAEDKRFYTHQGLDFIRIGGAVVSNLKSKSFSEGGSTISQQLVKNTQLSSEKTITRKLKEIKLTKQLEKQYTKDQILEFYLNNIYFGNGAYGIENASQHYFSKTAANLSLSEAALLAATINAPSIYDIENHPEKALSRRNLILDLMLKYGKISNSEHQTAKAEQINLNISNISNNNQIFNEIIKQTSSITKLTETMLKSSNLKIYTAINLSLQNQIQKIIQQNYSNQNAKVACLVLDNTTHQIVAETGSKQLFSNNLSIGSAAKPILVYAPAIENDIISPATKILDEKINISGYSPSNADKKFHGYVSAREALANSYNIPAVKILQELGTDKSQAFARKLGFSFTKNDNNLATALGSLENGINIKTLADAYSAFANSGNYTKSELITKITQNDKIIYEQDAKETSVMQSSTAYLITDMLKSTSKTGTAKRLKNLSYEIASKTGTVGKANSKNNLSAINVSYTSKHTIISYFAGDNLDSGVNGGTYPTMLTLDVLNLLYKNNPPKNFKIPNTVAKKSISKSDYNNNILSATDNPTDQIQEMFSTSNLPPISKSSLNLKLEVFNFENRSPILCFFTSPNYSYNVIRKENDKEKILATISDIDTEKITKIDDNTAKNDQIYTYLVEICEKSTNKIYYTNEIKLKTF